MCDCFHQILRVALILDLMMNTVLCDDKIKTRVFKLGLFYIALPIIADITVISSS